MKTDNQNEKLTGDNLPTESNRNAFEDYPALSERLLHAAHFWKTDSTWSATLQEINNVCEQLTNWQKSQPDNRVVVKDVIQAANEYALSTVKFDDSPLTTVQDDFIAGANWKKEQIKGAKLTEIHPVGVVYTSGWNAAIEYLLNSLT